MKSIDNRSLYNITGVGNVSNLGSGVLDNIATFQASKNIKDSGVSINDVIQNNTPGSSTSGAVLEWTNANGVLVQDSTILKTTDGHIIDGLLETDTEGEVVKMDTIFPLNDNKVQVLGSYFHNGIEVYSSLGLPFTNLSDILWRRTTDNHLMHNDVDLEAANVVGPSSATDNGIVRFDTTTGKLIQNSGVTINDTSDIDGSRSINFITSVSNPGSTNTLWIRSSDNHLMRNNVDVEASGTGDVVGPSSATDNAIVRFDTTTGKLIQNSGVTINDTNDLSGIRSTTFTSNASNPAGTNSLWLNSTNSHIYKGSNDLENIFEYKFLNTFTPNSSSKVIPVWSPDKKWIAACYTFANSSAGTIYIYSVTNNVPTFVQQITGSDTASNHVFARSVCFDYNATRLVVGATGANSNQGACYSFVRSGTTWTQEQKFTPSVPVNNENFGNAVHINYAGDIAVIGCPNDPGGNSRALIFTRSGSVWSQTQQLSSPSWAVNGNGDKISYAIDMTWDADRIMIGVAHRNGAFIDSGLVSVFKRDSPTTNNWTVESNFIQSDPSANAYFGGFSLAMAANGSISCIQSWGASNGGSGNGKIYVFQRNGTTWTQKQIITPPSGDLGIAQNFGGTMSISYDGQSFVTILESTKYYYYTLSANGQFILAQTFTLSAAYIYGEAMSLSCDGQSLALGSSTGVVEIWGNVSQTFVSGPDISTLGNLVSYSSLDGKTIADSGVLSDGSGGLTLTRLYGVHGNTVSNRQISTINSSGQLGSTTELSIDNTYNVTTVTQAMSPYTVLATDQVIAVNGTGVGIGTITINLPSAVTKRKLYIGDIGGTISVLTTITINAQVGQTVANAGSITINAANDWRHLISDGVSRFFQIAP